MILLPEGQEPIEPGEATDHQLNEVIGQELVNWEHVSLGQVERVVEVNGTTYAILAAGGPLSTDRPVILPFEKVSFIKGVSSSLG